MKQLLKEIGLLILIIPISLGILFFAMQKAEQSGAIESLSAKIEKKELTISSPAFGSLEKIWVSEGDIVKKNEVIATINLIGDNTDFQVNSDIYIYNKNDGTILVKAPVDAVVSRIDLAEKSTLKPAGDLLTLLPLASTQIEIKSEKSLSAYEYMYLTDKDDKGNYSIKLSKRLPISDKDGNVYYFAVFNDQNQANDFYANQEVVVKGKKKTKALTGQVQKIFSQAVKNVSVIINNLI